MHENNTPLCLRQCFATEDLYDDILVYSKIMYVGMAVM
jgi:hypothetical protein